MTVRLADWSIGSLLLDIEGTTTPIDFVVKTLFPYARKHVESFLAASVADTTVAADLTRLEIEHAQDLASGRNPPPLRTQSDAPGAADPASVAAYIRWLIDRDRKSTGLKALQGRIWERAYRTGELAGQVFPDVAPALARWRARGLDVRIYSSGSVLAQQLLFSTCADGDLTRLLNGYFDTAIGPKRSAESYVRIAGVIGLPASRILFVSDVVAELDAAAEAGLRTALAVRPGNPPSTGTTHPVIANFDDIEDT